MFKIDTNAWRLDYDEYVAKANELGLEVIQDCVLVQI